MIWNHRVDAEGSGFFRFSDQRVATEFRGGSARSPEPPGFSFAASANCATNFFKSETSPFETLQVNDLLLQTLDGLLLLLQSLGQNRNHWNER